LLSVSTDATTFSELPDEEPTSGTGTDTGAASADTGAAGAAADTDVLVVVRLDAHFLAAEEAVFFVDLVVFGIIIYLNNYFLSVLTHNILYYTIEALYS